MSARLVSWYITFGLGTPDGQLYTEVRVSADLDVREQGEAVRQAVYARYGRAWAFDYPPEQFEDAIAAYNLRLREVVTA